jgi:hypothetical protein
VAAKAHRFTKRGACGCHCEGSVATQASRRSMRMTGRPAPDPDPGMPVPPPIPQAWRLLPPLFSGVAMTAFGHRQLKGYQIRIKPFALQTKINYFLRAKTGDPSESPSPTIWPIISHGRPRCWRNLPVQVIS